MIWCGYRDVGEFLRKEIGNEIVQDLREGFHKNEGDVNWIFSDIIPNSFRWCAQELIDSEKT